MLSKILCILLALGNVALTMDKGDAEDSEDIERALVKKSPGEKAERVTTNKGLNVGDTFDYLFQSQAKAQNVNWNSCWPALGAAACMLAFPGVLPGALMAGIVCPVDLHAGVCIAGLTFVAVPFVAAIVGIPINRFYNSCKKSKELQADQNLRTRLTNEFIKGRHRSELLTREDMEYLGYQGTMQFLSWNNYFRRLPSLTLTAHQVLWLAEQDVTSYRYLAERGGPDSNFSGRGHLLVIKLLKLLSLSPSVLRDTLNESETLKLFHVEPELFASFTRCLQKNHRIDEALEKQLAAIKTIIEQIESEESEDQSNSKESNDFELLASSGKQFFVNRNRLACVSSKFCRHV